MVTLKVNGVEHSFDGDERMPLLWYLRDILGLTGSDPEVGLLGTLAEWGARDAASPSVSAPCSTMKRSVVGWPRSISRKW